ncbi:hypothetical protein H4219_005842 [Mycoemilia scoparia]|uniref:Uncharacterized protein n=1 Tax=Mycoemilia scoparia TaxID=417184 RepID=A0A9W7ZST8_9FUNG|nr:hypothetical protein H4219_005842 [Mycoemilia scoparia]
MSASTPGSGAAKKLAHPHPSILSLPNIPVLSNDGIPHSEESLASDQSEQEYSNDEDQTYEIEEDEDEVVIADNNSTAAGSTLRTKRARANGDGKEHSAKRRAVLNPKISEGTMESKENDIARHYEDLENDGTFVKLFGNTEADYYQQLIQFPQLGPSTQQILDVAIEIIIDKHVWKSFAQIWGKFTTEYQKKHAFGTDIFFEQRYKGKHADRPGSSGTSLNCSGKVVAERLSF